MKYVSQSKLLHPNVKCLYQNYMHGKFEICVSKYKMCVSEFQTSIPKFEMSVSKVCIQMSIATQISNFYVQIQNIYIQMSLYLCQNDFCNTDTVDSSFKSKLTMLSMKPFLDTCVEPPVNLCYNSFMLSTC